MNAEVDQVDRAVSLLAWGTFSLLGAIGFALARRAGRSPGARASLMCQALLGILMGAATFVRPRNAVWIVLVGSAMCFAAVGIYFAFKDLVRSK